MEARGDYGLVSLAEPGMNAALLIDRLDGVRRSGPGRWIAKCPAHSDRSPSLAVREIDDRLLVHCFSGCEPAAIVEAAGLDLSDLFPNSFEVSKPRYKPALISAADALEMIHRELCHIAVIASALGRGEALVPAEKDRLLLSIGRVLQITLEARR